MRDLKFRIWNVIQREWYNPGILKIDYKGDVYYQRDGQYIINQYTGLIDKNGKEVYEGDIVLNKSRRVTGEVFYNKLYARFIIRDSDRVNNQDFCDFNYTDELKILGNIYENPGLLATENEDKPFISPWSGRGIPILSNKVEK